MFSLNNDVIFSVFWLRKTSHIKSANWWGFPIFFLSASTYGMTISFKCFKFSWVLLWCFIIALKLKPVGKVTFGKDCLVFHLQIAWNVKAFPSVVKINVRMMFRLSAIPARPNFFEPFGAIVKGRETLGVEYSKIIAFETCARSK